jgi:hypothetical protein
MDNKGIKMMDNLSFGAQWQGEKWTNISYEKLKLDFRNILGRCFNQILKVAHMTPSWYLNEINVCLNKAS